MATQNDDVGTVGAWILAIIAVFFLLSKCGGGDHTVSPSDDESSAALSMCQDRVKDRLKSPASAEFASRLKSTITKPSSSVQRYYVVSHVDAQNSFGAKLRSSFTCDIEFVGKKDSWDSANWRLIDLNME